LIDQEVLSEKLDKFYKCEEEIGWEEMKKNVLMKND
jgi:hypothetical protein